MIEFSPTKENNMAELKDIIGYEKEVIRLEKICDFLKNTKKYVDFEVELPKCMLFCGESGIGKTFMAEALIHESGRVKFEYDFATFNIKKMKSLFKKAKKCANSVVFIDDIDCIADDEDNRIYSYLSYELSRVKNGEVFVILTAESKKSVPEYFVDEITPSMTFELDLPKIDEACKIFKPIFDENKMDDSFDLHDFCCFVQGCTYRDVERVYNEAERLAVYDGSEKISEYHLVKAYTDLNDEELADEYSAGSAYHESGHAAVDLLLGGTAACMVLKVGKAGFYKQLADDIDDFSVLQRRYVVSIAGKTCEEMFTGTNSIGSYNDLKRLSMQIEHDVRSLASKGFEYYDTTELDSPAYSNSIAKKIQEELQSFYDMAKELLTQNKLLVDKLAEALKNKHYLMHSEIMQIYKDYSAAK